MKLVLSEDGVNCSENLAGHDFVTSLHIDRAKAAIECEVAVSMLYKHTLIVSRHHENLLYNAVKHRFSLSPFLDGYIHAIIRRKFKVLEYRMVLLAELLDYRSVYRPWKLAFILGKFGR